MRRSPCTIPTISGAVERERDRSCVDINIDTNVISGQALHQPVTARSASTAPAPAARPLADFTADPRVLTLTLMAAVIGVAGAGVAKVLDWLIGFFTHVFYYGEFVGGRIAPAH